MSAPAARQPTDREQAYQAISPGGDTALRTAAQLLADCVAAEMLLPYTLPALTGNPSELPAHIVAALRWLGAQCERDPATAFNQWTLDLMAAVPLPPEAIDDAATIPEATA